MVRGADPATSLKVLDAIIDFEAHLSRYFDEDSA